MAFRDNSRLITSASDSIIGGEGFPGISYAGIDASAFTVADYDVYRQRITGFGSDDTLITSRPILDGNSDGFIELNDASYIRVNFGYVQDETVERDIVQIFGDEYSVTALRNLGEKGGAYVYADARTITNLTDRYGVAAVIEGDVGNDALDMGSGSKMLLVDNGLGLNLGGDRINNFGDDDLLVFTRKIYDRNGDGVIQFSKNGVLDISGSMGPKASDPVRSPGGQIQFLDPEITSLELVRSEIIEGIAYYFYGTEFYSLAN